MKGQARVTTRLTWNDGGVSRIAICTPVQFISVQQRAGKVDAPIAGCDRGRDQMPSCLIAGGCNGNIKGLRLVTDARSILPLGRVGADANFSIISRRRSIPKRLWEAALRQCSASWRIAQMVICGSSLGLFLHVARLHWRVALGRCRQPLALSSTADDCRQAWNMNAISDGGDYSALQCTVIQRYRTLGKSTGDDSTTGMAKRVPTSGNDRHLCSPRR